MRVAITGTTGRVGAALARQLAPRHEIMTLPRAACDFSNTENLKAALDSLECDIFINPAALTSLEACEDDPRLAMRVNSAAPGIIRVSRCASAVKKTRGIRECLRRFDSRQGPRLQPRLHRARRNHSCPFVSIGGSPTRSGSAAHVARSHHPRSSVCIRG